MQRKDSGILLSASDLANFLNCPHVSTLDLLLLDKKIPFPEVQSDPALALLVKKGEDFEKGYIDQLAAEGRSIAYISRDKKQAAYNETMAAMRAGVEVIYQARLELDEWNGWADFLLKVNKPGRFGDWSYEVEDTKLARNTKAATILQICLYGQMLVSIQGIQPEYMHIRTPEGRITYRCDEFMGYFRLMQKKLLNAIRQNKPDTYPEPVLYCDICRWWTVCNNQRRRDDHLSFIAGMGSSQIREVKKWGIHTLHSMAHLPPGIPYKPSRGSIDTYKKLREQARVQWEARESKKNVVELLDVQPDIGLNRLPEPSPGDMFFDFESDPFVTPNGREYLFGWVHQSQYDKLWAFTEEEEKKAFEEFMDRVTSIRNQYPGMHIYHYSSYETGAIKRLMGKHATKEHEVDALLRAGVFVDLHLVTRHAIRAGIESYSLKDLEKLHDFVRYQELREAGQHRALVELMLESGIRPDSDSQTIAIVMEYNKEDCMSTLSLRNWLEALRLKQIDAGYNITRPVVQRGDTPEKLKEYQLRAKPLFDKLMHTIPPEKKDRSPEEQAKWLLAHMLEWYHRENKAFWWNYFRLMDLPDEELLDERDAIAGLRFTGRIERVAKSEVHYYSFPEQDADMRLGADVRFRDEGVGSLYYVDWQDKILGIKKSNKGKDIHPTNIISSDRIDDKPKREAIFRIAGFVVSNGMTGNGSYKAGRDLLMRNPPSPSSTSASDAQQHAVDWVLQLNDEVLPVQGPPGTGKSYTAAKMIIELLKAGKKIGVTALSHKVITALLQKVHDLAISQGQNISIIQKVSETTKLTIDGWTEATTNAEVEAALQQGVQIAAGTSFMWARPEFFETVDVLFVDEAGQLALIDTVALSHAGKNLVLLGDPQQLQQPQQGSHPEGTEVSALEHILQGEQTISKEKGVFLDTTWRLHPAICGYTSTLFYQGRLQPKPQNANQRLMGNTKYQQPGIYLEMMTHTGNKNDSPEEVQRVLSIINDLLQQEVYFTDSQQQKSRLTARNIKVISPYNAQVNALQAAMPDIETGTVDKFQGQEAAVIIFSMATSAPEDAPRGMEFLYSLNRLNVAVSRARAVFILVASEALLQPNCRTPQQVKLANALCSLVERAHIT